MICLIIVYYYYTYQIYKIISYDDSISDNFDFEKDEIDDDDINHKEGNNNNNI